MEFFDNDENNLNPSLNLGRENSLLLALLANRCF